jgi:hypothetical protein
MRVWREGVEFGVDSDDSVIAKARPKQARMKFEVEDGCRF